MTDRIKTKAPKNKLEEINEEICGLYYIKKYSCLTNTSLTPTQINIIELILSFQLGGNKFYMSRKKMAIIINSTDGTVRKEVSILRGKKLIEGEQFANENYAGSRAPLTVNIDVLCDSIKSSINVEPINEASVIEVTEEPSTTLEVAPPTNDVTEFKTESVLNVPIVFEDFDVKDALKRYVEDETVITIIDAEFTKYRLKNDIQTHTLENLLYFIYETQGEYKNGVEIFRKICDDLNKLGKLEKIKRDAAA